MDLTQELTPLTSSKRRVLITIAALATLIYLGAGFAVDSPRILEAMSQLGWLGCGMVLALSVANYLIRFQRWQIFVRALGHRIPYARHLLYYLSGFAFTVSPAKAGEAVRSLYLRHYGVGYAQSIAALFVERLQDLLAMALLASLVVLDRPAYEPLVAGALLLVLILLLVASLNSLPALLDRFASGLQRRRIARLLSVLSGLLRSSRVLLRPQLLFAGTAIGVISWGGEGLGFYLICQGLHLAVGISVAIGVYALAVLAGSAAFFLPAGIGGMEIVMTTLLMAHGAPLRSAVVATLLCRVATLWFAVLIGIAAATAVEIRPRGEPLRAAP
jgi:uncharacterized protein (TIRG00374 family)